MVIKRDVYQTKKCKIHKWQCIQVLKIKVQVIQRKEKSNINALIIVDCAANIFTLLLHTFIHTPLFKLRSDSMQCFSFAKVCSEQTCTRFNQLDGGLVFSMTIMPNKLLKENVGPHMKCTVGKILMSGINQPFQYCTYRPYHHHCITFSLDTNIMN